MRAGRFSRTAGGCASIVSRRTRLSAPVLTRLCACLYIDWVRFSSALTFLPVLAVMNASGVYGIDRKECCIQLAYLWVLTPAGSSAIRSHLLIVNTQGLYCFAM